MSQARGHLRHPARRGRTRSGADVTRFVMLTRKNDVALDFDFDKVLEQSKDNPVFYVQYANARVNSVLRKAREAGVAVDDATLAAARSGASGACGRTGADPQDRRMAASGGNRRHGATSRTGWPSTFMNWPRTSTGCGTAAMTTPACASCRTIRPHRRRKSPLRGPWALSFPQVLVSLASLRSRKCADQQAPRRGDRRDSGADRTASQAGAEHGGRGFRRSRRRRPDGAACARIACRTAAAVRSNLAGAVTSVALVVGLGRLGLQAGGARCDRACRWCRRWTARCAIAPADPGRRDRRPSGPCR